MKVIAYYRSFHNNPNRVLRLHGFRDTWADWMIIYKIKYIVYCQINRRLIVHISRKKEDACLRTSKQCFVKSGNYAALVSWLRCSWQANQNLVPVAHNSLQFVG